MRTLRRIELLVAGARKENRVNRCENGDGRVAQDQETPVARLIIHRLTLGRCRNRFDESITLPRHRLDVSRARALVAKHCSQAADDDVKTVMEVDVPVRPQPALDLFTGNQLAGALEQQTQQIDRLSAEPHGLPSSPQRPSAIVELEVSEHLYQAELQSERSCFGFYVHDSP